MPFISQKLRRETIYLSKNGRSDGDTLGSCGLLYNVNLSLPLPLSLLNKPEALIAKGIGVNDENSFPEPEAWAGVASSHIFHLVSALTLHNLSRLLLKGNSNGHQIAFAASCLHIVSPAGIFLSAPYGESLFSCLHHLGYYLFAKALLYQAELAFWKHDLMILLSGFLIALATSIRSNGLASGILFLYEVFVDGLHILKMGPSLERARKMAFTIAGGLSVSIGSIVPQYIAYRLYCRESESVGMSRQWCNRTIPSIYDFVQKHYW